MSKPFVETDKKVVIANWKMKPGSLTQAKKIFSATTSFMRSVRGVEVGVAPPFPFIQKLSSMYSGTTLSLGAQDLFWEKTGSYTGEVSASQIKSVGGRFAIVGHSERRALGETSKTVSKKIKTTLKEELVPILCVGETKRDSSGDYLSFLRKEIQASLENISSEELKNIVIAYEPIWAIGKSASFSMDKEELHATVIFIRKVLTSVYDRDSAKEVKILYGGSVEPSNAKDLYNGMVDGFLVGHASLVPKDFEKIVKAAP